MKLSGIALKFIKYRLTDVAPYNSLEALPGFLKKAKDASEWLRLTTGLDLRGRIPNSIKKVIAYEEVRGSYGRGMFYFLQAISELENIIELSNSLRDSSSKRFVSTIKKAIKGPLFCVGDEGTPGHESRNYLFELLVAARLVESGCLVDLAGLTDVVVLEPYLAVECKRVSSSSQVVRRVGDAIKQIESRKEEYQEGAVFLDVTSVLESLCSVSVVDEAAFPEKFAQPSNPEQLGALLARKVWHDVGDDIEAMKANILRLLSDKVPCVVICCNYVGFHRSLSHERAVTGTCSYPLVRSSSLSGPAWTAISKTLGERLDSEF